MSRKLTNDEVMDVLMESDESGEDFSDGSSDNYKQSCSESRDEDSCSSDDGDFPPSGDIIQTTIENVTEWSTPNSSFQPRKRVSAQ